MHPAKKNACFQFRLPTFQRNFTSINRGIRPGVDVMLVFWIQLDCDRAKLGVLNWPVPQQLESLGSQFHGKFLKNTQCAW